MNYETLVENLGGYEIISCTDEQIDALPADSHARFLRDELREGVYVTSAEVAKAYWTEAGGPST